MMRSMRWPNTPVRTAVLLDAAFEFVVAVALVLAGGALADAFNVDRIVMWIAAGVFLAAALAIGGPVFTAHESRDFVGILAIANIVGGVALWALLGVFWGHFEPGGRWALVAVADMFILIGILEIVALRRTPARD